MKWNQLLSTKRRSGTDIRGDSDLRSEFEKDYHKVIESAAFRRLQDKTQVFPLDKSDFIRTRLTHSLEVSSLCRSLGQNISKNIIKEGLDNSFTEDTGEKICEILQCSGLIHDIGNPPFGHFGEEALREWFKKNLGTLRYKDMSLSELLDEQEISDLVRFEGNAQGLRLITGLDHMSGKLGMDLTFGLLSAIIKYPVTSSEADSTSADIKYRKHGYFKSESALFEEISAETGTGKNRNPLVLILEAADDIAYGTADIEDAFKKGFFDYKTFVRELGRRGVSEKYIGELETMYGISLENNSAEPEECAIYGWLSAMQEEMIIAATSSFTGNYGSIMEGTYSLPLIYGSDSEILLNALKSIAYDYAFTSDSIFKTEIAANTILMYIMDVMIPAILDFDNDKPPGLMEEKFITLIPESYIHCYRNRTKDLCDRDKVYYKILLVTDFIGGMTDGYARDLYYELHGGILH